jgi:DNA-binding LacI/PurR family transcriptional regulator
MVRNMAVARELGFLHVPGNTLIELRDIENHRPEQVVIISTGSQGEPLSALSRMANREHPVVTLQSGDTVVLASSLIPGNESAVYRVINGLSRLGAHVVHKGNALVHVSGHAAAGELLDAAAPPTAMTCASDEIALGALAAARERGLRVPGDLAVTGWDDIQVARYVTPALTTVRQPLRLIGARAAELLFARIHTGASPSGEVLPTELVVRASCGCAQSSQTS